MHLLDRDIVNSSALVVDGNPTSRSILSAQLRDFGVGTVVQCSRIQDARKQLELRSFDVVLCEHHFHSDQDYTAQNMLDDLRRNQLLPLSTVFIVVTSAASYAMVAEAAESALDSFLLKPHTATALGERLTQARQRKRALGDIFNAIEKDDHASATRLCLQRFEERAAYWLYSARIGTELLLRQGRHEEAKQLCSAVLEIGPHPWARLAIARAQIEGNQPSHALRTLEGLLADHPTHVEAYDVMGHVQVEQGGLGDALDTYRKASALTPGSITRLQKHGMLAFYLGDREESARMLERAAAIGISSKMFDPQSLVLLAFSRFDQRDSKGLQRCLENLQHALERAPQSRRLQRFVSVATVLSRMLQKQTAAIVTEINPLVAELREPGLDIEAGCNLLALLAQLASAGSPLDGCEDWIDSLGLRFTSSKGMTELLASAAATHAPFAQRVREAHARIGEMAEQAVTHTVQGNHRAAVQTLIAHADRTLNAKLMEMARMTLQRHGAKIDDAEPLTTRLDSLRSRYASGAGAALLGQPQGRQPGALSLRAAKPADAAPPEAAAA